MYDWFDVVNEIIDYIDDNATENPSLNEISNFIGYSSYYCSELFKNVTDMTIKEYIAKRRLSLAAIELINSNDSLLKIALDFGYSSQQAFNRAFKNTFNCTPSQCRINKIPIPLTNKKNISELIKEKRGQLDMSKISVPTIKIEYIPEHRYLGVYEESYTNNGWLYPSHKCEELCGIINSIKESHPIITHHTAGWKLIDGHYKYFYGLGVDVDYDGIVPEGFILTDIIPGSYYIVFKHPPFDFYNENDCVTKLVEDMAFNFNPRKLGYKWNEKKCQIYQRHYPKVIGYEILRPVTKIVKRKKGENNEN